MTKKFRLGFAMIAFLAGCTTVALPRYDQPLLAVTPAEALERGTLGGAVRWGGAIIEAKPGKDETCFEISSRPLDSDGEPLDNDQTFGRFLACAKGFHEPSVYAAGRKLTVVGSLAGAVAARVGEHEFRLPVLKVDTLHLWPLPQVLPRPYYDPFWGPAWRPRIWHR